MGKPWKKLWVEKLRSSPKWMLLTLSERGFYMECLMLCNDEGEVRTGEHWYSWRDISRDFNTRIRTAQRIAKRLVEMDLLACGKPVGNLWETCGKPDPGGPIVSQLSDNVPHLVVQRASELQHVYVREPRKDAASDTAYQSLKLTEEEAEEEAETTTTAVGLRPLLLLNETA